ncbi:MAG TPA: MG2 domain-containing protein, partial [Caldimonas sp.]
MHRFTRTAALLLCAGSVLGARAVTISSVTPTGEIAQVRQITVKFSEAAVAFGDPRLADPMALSCQGATPAGSGRWANDRVWLYDFREALAPGTRCTLSARPDWKPLNGALTGSTEFAFNTGGPAVVSMQPYDGSEVEEDQHFLLRLSGAAVAASVAANAWCEVEGLGERLALRGVAGELRAQLLKARGIDKAQAERTLVATCARPLPNGAAVRVIWGKGIAAAANPKVVTNIEQRYRFKVRPAFTAEFSCERERASAPCLPIRPLSLRFSAPVAREAAAQVRLKPAAGAALAPVFDKDDKAVEVNEVVFPKPLAENSAFTIELPRELKDNAGRSLANAASFPLQVATGDAPPIAKFAAAPFGIVELNGDAMLPLTLRHVQPDLRPDSMGATGRGQVRVKLLQSDADILAWYAKLRHYDEAQLTARELGLPQAQWTTLEESTDAKGRVTKRGVDRRIGTREVSLLAGDIDARRLDLPQLAGGDPRPFEVIGIPLSQPDYHVVEIESRRLGESLLDKKAPMFVRTGALVTNLGLHFKHGRENSAVWVTSLDRGKPVAGADAVVNDCNGNPLWKGRTDARGIALVPLALDPSVEHCVDDSGLFVTVRKADPSGRVDTAFVFSSWQKGIEAWRFNVPTGSGTEPDVRAHTVFDRTLLRAGETVSMKHFVRLETSAGLGAVRPDALPTRLKIVHEGSGEEFVQALQWIGNRAAVSNWNIPPAAKLGIYNVVLEREAANEERRHAWTSGNFRVEEFRLPLVDARISGPKAVPIAPASLPIEVQLNYFSGGGKAQAAARA